MRGNCCLLSPSFTEESAITSKLSCVHNPRHPQAAQRCPTPTLVASGPTVYHPPQPALLKLPHPHSDHCNYLPSCNVNPSLTRMILPNCSCDQNLPPAPSYDPSHHSGSHLKFPKTAHKTLHGLSSTLHCPTLRSTTANLHCPEFPPDTPISMTPGASPSWAALSHLTCSKSHFRTSLKFNLPVKLCLTAPGG